IRRVWNIGELIDCASRHLCSSNHTRSLLHDRSAAEIVLDVGVANFNFVRELVPRFASPCDRVGVDVGRRRSVEILAEWLARVATCELRVDLQFELSVVPGENTEA